MSTPFNCPKCQQPMTKGTVQVRGTALGFFMVGMSYQNLYFDDPVSPELRGVPWGRGKETLILGSREEVRGYRCLDCRITVIER